MSKRKWLILSGLFYITFMFVIMGLLWPWLNNEPITTRTILGSLVSGLGGGFVFICMVYYQLRKKEARLKADGDKLSTP
ncbi:hypothetical protein INP83_07790 [Mucilaginibacter sp. 21P]|uniref:hypothetical protein n=1 Tax=Mucilaginibacter sp. 21P TaxID=2778902 RepID=UPI001C5A4D24|nr:hypothetical protein [Mucilaginibacter sp. 21P]QXV66973.1 hypothetical protein INP83_07790 [Mucilaginibacter sp. 21P]